MNAREFNDILIEHKNTRFNSVTDIEAKYEMKFKSATPGVHTDTYLEYVIDFINSTNSHIIRIPREEPEC